MHREGKVQCAEEVIHFLRAYTVLEQTEGGLFFMQQGNFLQGGLELTPCLGKMVNQIRRGGRPVERDPQYLWRVLPRPRQDVNRAEWRILWDLRWFRQCGHARATDGGLSEVQGEAQVGKGGLKVSHNDVGFLDGAWGGAIV